jgi:ATP-dependent Clp protease ATP-binding subunit ClpC
MTAPPDLRDFDEKIAAVRRDKESAIDAQDFERAAKLRDSEKQLLIKKTEREKQWKAGDLDVVAEVDDEQIAEVLANWTGIPVFKLTEAETTRFEGSQAAFGLVYLRRPFRGRKDGAVQGAGGVPLR